MSESTVGSHKGSDMDNERMKLFKGTGEKNREGLSLEEFLEEYNPKEYDSPAHTVDSLVFRYPKEAKDKKILMIKRINHPNIGFWALPGGFVDMEEELETAAARELEEETGLSGIQMEQLGTYGAIGRDPRTRVISTAYIGIVPEDRTEIKAGDDALEAAWFDVQMKELQEEEILFCGVLYIERTYHLMLKDENAEITLDAKIQCRFIKEGRIRKTEFRVLKSSGLAGDHPAMIVQGLIHLEKVKE